MAAITLQAVEKRYGAVTPVQSLSFEVAQGELLALLGPSGCGKTTTLRLVAGLTDVSAGRITIGGRDVTRLPAYDRNVGLVFQSYALFPHMTVEQNVAYGLRVRRVPAADRAARVRRTLEMVQMADYADRLPAALSGGQQQRVALARAVVIEPDVLLLDEPLSALDAKLRLALRQEIKRLQQTLGVTTICVTHDQEEALSLADRVILMNAGRIEQSGTPQDLYQRPASRFVADFIGRCNFLEGGRENGHFRTRSGLRLTLAPGPGATLCLRPEAIQLDPPASIANRLPATIASALYVGAATEYDVSLASGETLSVHSPVGTPRSVGAPVTIGWAAEAGWLV